MAITAYMLNNPNKPIKVTEVAKNVGASKGSVSLTLKKLTKEGIVRDLHVDISDPRVRAMKIMINVQGIVSKGIISKLKKYTSGAGLYGSWANGTNTEDSDVDIWIKPKKSFKQALLGKLSGEISAALGAEVQLLVLSKERIENLKKDNVVFYHSLLFSSMQLYGEGIE
jgi:predicted nucleotidyltransferase